MTSPAIKSIRGVCEHSRLALERESESRAGRLDLVEIAILSLVVGVFGLGWIALTLAELGRFSLAGVLLISVASIGTIAWFGRRRGWLPVLRQVPAAIRERAADLRLSDLAMLAVLLVAAPIYCRPFEYLLSASDPGVYVNTGISIARSGGILIYDKDYLALPPELRYLVLREEGSFGSSSSHWGKYEGYYVGDVSSSAIEPHGVHLYPALLAIGYAIGGLSAELLVTPLLALLGFWTYYIFLRRLFSPIAGLLATTWLSLSVGETWFGRYPTAEIAVQVLLLAGLFCLSVIGDTNERRRVAGAVGGFLVGCVFLTKVEQLIPVAAIGLFVASRSVFSRQATAYRWFLGTLLVVSAHVVLHDVLIARVYAFSSLASGFTIGWRLLTGTPFAPALIVVAAVSLIFFWRRSRRRWTDPGRVDNTATGSVGSAWPAGIIGIVGAALMAFAYYVRPRSVIDPSSGGFLAGLADSQIVNAMSLLHLTWYVTPLGILLATVGLLYVTTGRLERRALPFVVIVVLETVWCIYDVKAVPIHFWLARRWIPIVIPGMIALASFALVKSASRLEWRWPTVALPLSLAVVILISSAGASLPFLRHNQYAGSEASLRRFAGSFEANAVVLFRDDDAGIRVSPPTQLAFDRSSFILWKSASSTASVADLVRYWEGEGRPVYVVQMRDVPAPAPAVGVTLRPVGEYLFDFPEAEVKRDGLPSRIGRYRTVVDIYSAETSR